MAVNTNVNLKYPVRNADGVLQHYGNNESLVDRGQYLNTLTGSEHLAVFNVDFADAALGVDATHNYVLSYGVFIPKGAYISKVEFEVTAAWDSASNDVALNFGLLRYSDYEIIDADGLMDTVPKTALDTAGAIVSVYKGDSLPAASTYVGAELGSIRATNQLVSCFWENNAPTVGSGILKVYYRVGLKA
jgi:hypothetical protein